MHQQDYTRWHLPKGATVRLGKGEVNDIKFSPDGALLAAGTSIGVWLYDANTGAEIALLAQNSTVDNDQSKSSVNVLAFSADSTTLACGNINGTIEIWDLETRSLKSIFAGNWAPVKALMFTEEDTKLACASGWGGTQWGNDGTARLWNLSDGTYEPIVPALDKTGEELLVAFSPDGRFLAVACASVFWGRKKGIPAIQLWDIGTWRCVFRIEEQTKSIRALTFSPDSKTLASAEGSEGVKLWDVESGTLIYTLKNAALCQALEFSPDSSLLVSGSPDGIVRLWDIDNDGVSSVIGRMLNTALGHRPIRLFKGHAENSQFKALVFSPDGKKVASANSDGTVRMWNADIADQKFSLAQHTGTVSALAFNDVHTKLLDSYGEPVHSASYKRTLTSLSVSNSQVSFSIWDIDAGRNLSIEMIDNGGEDTSKAVVSPNVNHFITRDITANHDNVVRLWDAHTKRMVSVLGGQEKGGFVPEMVFSSDGKLFAVSSRKNNSIQVWDVPNRQTLSRLEGHTTCVYSLAFSPDNKTIVSSGWTDKDKTLRLWDTMAGAELATFEDQGAVAFAPDGSSFVGGTHIYSRNPETGTYDSEIRLEDIGYSDPPTSITYSPDGTILVSGSRHGFIQLRDTTTGKILSTHTGHTSYISVLVFSADNTVLATAGGDGTILMWDWEKITS